MKGQWEMRFRYLRVQYGNMKERMDLWAKMERKNIRKWREKGRRCEKLHITEPIINWFTETLQFSTVWLGGGEGAGIMRSVLAMLSLSWQQAIHVDTIWESEKNVGRLQKSSLEWRNVCESWNRANNYTHASGWSHPMIRCRNDTGTPLGMEGIRSG